MIAYCRCMDKVRVAVASVALVFVCAIAMACFAPAAHAVDTVQVQVAGKYYVKASQATLNRINEIRYEACKQGVPDPRNPSKKLKTSDYVPMKWSKGLEEIAIIRAPEAVVVLDHYRPNGYLCFTAVSSEGVETYGENIAWNSGSASTAVKQWYGEKSDWVKKRKNKVTGHYESLINPDFVCIGMSGFKPNSSSLGWAAFVAEFSYYQDSSSKAAELGSKTVSVETHPDCVKNIGASLPDTIALGASTSVSAKAQTISYGAAKQKLSVKVLPSKLASSDESVISVSSAGKLVGKALGTAEVTAKFGSKTYSKQVSVRKSMVAAEFSVDDQVYSGSAIKPAVTVTLDGEELVPGQDYSVSYSNCTKVGTAKVTVTGKGDYFKSALREFKINPQATSLAKLTPGKKAFTVKWKKSTSANASGYQVRYSLSPEMAGAKTVSVGKYSTVSKKVSKLKGGSAYYVQVRCYKAVNGKKYYSAWSDAQSVTTKK